MSTFGSVAFVYKGKSGYDAARICQVVGSDMMYSNRGKSICKALETMVKDINYMDDMQLKKAFACFCEYLNYQYFAYRERLYKQNNLTTSLYDYLPISYFGGGEISTRGLGTFMNDAFNWVYIKNITNEKVKIYVCENNSNRPNAIYELAPQSVCVLEWGALPKHNPYNKNLKRLGALEDLPNNVIS